MITNLKGNYSTVSIYDALGREAFKENFPNSKNIETTEWADGFYYIIFEEQSKAPQIFKILKK